ncbi:PadR family transcriptional regulator [Miniphocaeibacter massiliensis]|uniref:PadR family transcriptional regulator n=1 Tax=Miniphocaeibacter massiliensis TaxID=2041841 RepID=UPI000C1BA9D6|nr:PadR family transcriptional regulator [Miniphocaeibacter massiliensis]
MISSDVMRGFNDLLILSIINKGDSYGYEISKKITEISNTKYSLKETTLYSAFSRLEKNGYILGYESDKTFGRKRTYYKISKSGKIYLSSKLEEWNEIETVINLFVKYLEEV